MPVKSTMLTWRRFCKRSLSCRLKCLRDPWRLRDIVAICEMVYSKNYLKTESSYKMLLFRRDGIEPRDPEVERMRTASRKGWRGNPSDDSLHRDPQTE